MREIKFRGKSVETGKWEYGNLVITDHNRLYEMIDNERRYRGVIAFETVGQFTGLHDKNGKEIYEGDIVEFEDAGEEGYEYKEGFGFDNIAQVVYDNGIYTLSNFGENDNSYYATDGTAEEVLEEVLRNGNCEVIGNIYDNPELLGGINENRNKI